ncbi:antibiotic biosynthesis monooxygenase [Microbacterium sp. NPDC077663]|uniref:antibiotic biosynthesis monooxygenase n=1 Tax=Microbacterium sp. NPDC077663 TaxID=3364189 RepID=UPI0037C96B61
MTSPVDFVIRFTLADGAAEAFDAWAVGQLAAARAADGVLDYAIHEGADGTFVQHERYASEAAASAFAQERGPALGEWSQLARPSELLVLGGISEQFRAALPPFGTAFAPKHRLAR